MSKEYSTQVKKKNQISSRSLWQFCHRLLVIVPTVLKLHKSVVFFASLQLSNTTSVLLQNVCEMYRVNSSRMLAAEWC